MRQLFYLKRVRCPLGARPHQAFFNPKDGLLYVSTERDYALTIVDPKTRKVVGKVPTGQPESHDFVFSPDYKRAYTVNVFCGTISVLDIENRKLLNIVPIITDAVDPNAPAGGGGGGAAAFRRQSSDGEHNIQCDATGNPSPRCWSAENRPRVVCCMLNLSI